MQRLLIATTLVLLSICIVGRQYYTGKINELQSANAAYKAAYLRNAKTISALQAASDKANKILLQREAELVELKNKSEVTRIEVKEVIKNDPQAKNWADTPVPNSVLTRLRAR